MCEFCMGNFVSPGGRVRSTKNPQIGFYFLVDLFHFPIKLRVVGNREGKVVVKEFPKFFGEGRGELWTMIRDNLVIESKAEVDLVEKEVEIPSMVTVFFVGQRITLLVSPWLTTTKRESKPEDIGRSVMRLQEICWKGLEVRNWIGVRDGMVEWVFDLFCWQVAHPSIYRQMNYTRSGHQNSDATS